MSALNAPPPGLLRWRQRRIWHWFVSQAYTSGLISGSVSSGHPDGWIKHSLFWTGRRPYVLWMEREKWGYPWHLIRYRHWPLMVWGFCGKCGPWSCCGAVGYEHADDCPEAY